MELPDPESFADELPEGKKTNLEWEQLLRARFEPTTVDDTTVTEELDFVTIAEPDRHRRRRGRRPDRR